MTRLKYYFDEIGECNFCGHETVKNRILGQRLDKSQGRDPKSKFGITVSVIQCAKCGLIYSNPRPTPVDIQDHYGVPPEEYWKEEYFNHDPDYFSDQVSKAKELVSFRSGMTALDIGAGLGKAMISLDNSGFDTFGVEPSAPFRDRAISKMKIDPDRLRLGRVEDVDYEKNSFDFITFGAVLEHLADPAESIRKALGWLKPNGVIQIEVPSSKWLISRIINSYFRVRGTNYVTNLSPMHNPFHMYEFELKSFEAVAERLGFQIAEFTYDVCTIYHIPRPLHPMFKWYMKKFDKGMQLTVWLRKPAHNRDQAV